MKEITVEKAINKYIYMKRLKSKIANFDLCQEINIYHPRIQYLYHTIETKKLNGADMYNVMKALQTHLRKKVNEQLLDNKINTFEKSGGIDEYERMIEFLSENGVDINELH